MGNEAAARRRCADGDADAAVTGVADGHHRHGANQARPRPLALLRCCASRRHSCSRHRPRRRPGPGGPAGGRGASEVTALEPAPERDSGQIVAGYVAGILLFLALMTTGQLVSQGVVEEKSSRVVELLLSHRPAVAADGGQGARHRAHRAAAGGARRRRRRGDRARRWGCSTPRASTWAPPTLWALVWFVIGFATYSLVLAALASLVSRQEDVASVTGAGDCTDDDAVHDRDQHRAVGPDNPTGRWLSLHPVLRPMVMPIRIALGAVEAWEILAVARALAGADPGARLARRPDLLQRRAAHRRPGAPARGATRRVNAGSRARIWPPSEVEVVPPPG